MNQGDSKSALSEPFTVVLSASLAKQHFGTDDPIGKVLRLDAGDSYTVTGVIADVPDNSHFTFDFITSIVSNRYYNEIVQDDQIWEANWFTYVRTAPGLPMGNLQERVTALIHEIEAGRPESMRARWLVQPMTSIHLRSHMNFELGDNNNINLVYLFAATALAILLLACVNYTNLAIARSVKRAREVGLRQVVGANKWQLTLQFIGESMLLSFLAFGLALTVVLTVLPAFGSFVERNLTDGLAETPIIWGALLLTTFCVGLLSGSYPARIRS